MHGDIDYSLSCATCARYSAYQRLRYERGFPSLGRMGRQRYAAYFSSAYCHDRSHMYSPLLYASGPEVNILTPGELLETVGSGLAPIKDAAAVTRRTMQRIHGLHVSEAILDTRVVHQRGLDHLCTIDHGLAWPYRVRNVFKNVLLVGDSWDGWRLNERRVAVPEVLLCVSYHVTARHCWRPRVSIGLFRSHRWTDDVRPSAFTQQHPEQDRRSNGCASYCPRPTRSFRPHSSLSAQHHDS
ncbi:hypothetical protein NEOLEDRAFT_894580 [Neolentinus lepideus HHB14362 ss-1]|uniref:Uncharacterized protein n=1 Tax=Neolentinus lepideus HHB14362 ss-1 TaxID=1314782 RepID=A0A165NSG6_9AGAM|nr:hypothetical protein NEOLEDRAFT_894580 [Neolentinus lepideus HHB14362 ss-1]